MSKSLQEKIARIHRKKNAKVAQLRIGAQLHCSHENLVEVPYVPKSGILRALPPWRACKAYGFAERGWHCGYKILCGEAVEVTSNEADALRLGHVHPNGKFVRKGDVTDRSTLYAMAIGARP